MKDDRLSHLPSSIASSFQNSNPQFFREIRGKLKTRNIVTAAALSVVAQFLSVIYLLGKLPDLSDRPIQSGRYGVANMYAGNGNQVYYLKDEFGHWLVNWQLWWLDLFIILSFISIFTLALVGTYLLTADMTQEKERGTLNFIRLTPQSADLVLLGKILGVPILLYTAIAFVLPLHFIAGLQSHIPLHLILSFYLAAIASGGFIYCLALLWSLVELNIAGLKPWLASSLLGIFLLLTGLTIFGGYPELDRPWAWALMFNPATVIAYLVDACDLESSLSYLSTADLANLSFFGRTWWTNATTGIGFILFNFCLWICWCWSILKRRFYSPQSTLLNKSQSYGLTICFTLMALGFTLQQDAPCIDCQLLPSNIVHITENFTYLQVALCLFGLGLIFALSPQRQTIHDWARYRHQTHRHSAWLELILGENSPAIVAIALNQAIAFALVAPAILIVLPASKHYLLLGLVISASNIILCGVIAQLILTMKTRKRGVWSLLTVGSANILPLACLKITDLSAIATPHAWLFSFTPLNAVKYTSIPAIALALLGQWLAILLGSLHITRKLNRAGASETRVLSDRVSRN